MPREDSKRIIDKLPARDERTELAVSAYAGLYSKYGSQRVADMIVGHFCGFSWSAMGKHYQISRQSVHQTVTKILRDEASFEGTWIGRALARLDGLSPSEPSLENQRQQRVSVRRAIKLFYKTHPDKEYSVWDVSQFAGFAPMMSPLEAQKIRGIEAAVWIYEKFGTGLSHAGKYIRCSICKKFSARDEFCPSIKGGRSSTMICHSCAKERMCSLRKVRKTHMRKTARLWREKNRDKCRAAHQRYKVKKALKAAGSSS